MTEEQNKLAEELEKLMEEPSDRATARWVNINWPQLWNALRVEREPATEAVLERCFRALNEFDDDVDMEDYDSMAQWWQRHGGPALNAMRAALKGKVASQGVEDD